MAYLLFAPVCSHVDIASVCASFAKKTGIALFRPFDALPQKDAEDCFVACKTDDWEDTLVGAFHRQISGNSALIEGFGLKNACWTDKNSRAASALNASVVLVAHAENDIKATTHMLKLALRQYDCDEAPVAAFVVVDDKTNQAQQIDIGVPYLSDDVLQKLSADKPHGRLSPAAFRYDLMEKARKADKRIVLPEGAEPRTVEAAVICHEKKIARCVLLAKREEVEAVAKEKNLVLPDNLEIIDPASIADNYVAPLVEMRKSKGLTPEQAKEALSDSVFVGTMMMALDEVDGLVSGAVHTTANTIRPALQVIKTKPGASLVSSVFFMLMPAQVLVYGDCAVNPNPTANELADIAIQSADSAAAFGIEPRVAMISYSTGTSGAGADVEKVAEATRLVREKRPDLAVDGPLQYDAASVESVGRQKAPDSKVAGRATVFIFPDLNTGNCTYKAVQRSADVLSVGPMLQGLNKPVNDLSRGALVGDIVFTVALTAIQATQK